MASCEFNSHLRQLYFLLKLSKTLRCQFCTKMSDLSYLQKPRISVRSVHFPLLQRSINSLPLLSKVSDSDVVLCCENLNLRNHYHPFLHEECVDPSSPLHLYPTWFVQNRLSAFVFQTKNFIFNIWLVVIRYGSGKWSFKLVTSISIFSVFFGFYYTWNSLLQYSDIFSTVEV